MIPYCNIYFKTSVILSFYEVVEIWQQLGHRIVKST